MAIAREAFWMTAKLDGKCCDCEEDVEVGQRIVYDPDTRKAYCTSCGVDLIGDDPIAEKANPKEVRKIVSSRTTSRSQEKNQKKTKKGNT